jgi:hypothetical protein
VLTVPEPPPVILFAYARPDTLARTLDCLRRAEVPKIYAFCDGPKSTAVATQVEQVRALLRRVDWTAIEIVERTENMGLGRSIQAGVEQVLAKHDSIIVFEDDLLCSPTTYRYLAAALAHYRDMPAVMSVTGWTHPRVTPAGVGDEPYFDGRAESLVWGTWRRAWRGMERDANTLVMECRERGIDPYRYGADLVDMVAREHVRNLWAVRWVYLHILNGGLCLRPPRSMVNHIGIDDRATNASGEVWWENPHLASCEVPQRWPDPVEHPDCPALWRRAFVPERGRAQWWARHWLRRVVREALWYKDRRSKRMVSR